MSQTTNVPAASKPDSTKSDRATQRRNRTVRLVVLALGLVIVTALGTAHRFGVPVVGVDALCPFGGIETFWSMVVSAQLIQRIAVSSVILMGIVLVTAVVFRRSFCGYICPLGALQEFFGKIGLAIFRGKRPTLPAAIDKPARYLKYVVLVVFVVWTWQAASLMIRPYDPWVAWMHLTSPELFTEFGIGAAVLGVSLVGSIVYDRFFCKYLCPMGGFLGAISRFSIFKVRRNESTLHRLQEVRPRVPCERRGLHGSCGQRPRVHRLQRVRQRVSRQGHARGLDLRLAAWRARPCSRWSCSVSWWRS